MERTDLPLFCTQPKASMALLAADDAIYFAYERERDFLSAPKTFVICLVPPDSIINVNICHANEAQWLVLESEPFGVYRYLYDDETFYVFYGESQLFDVQAETLELAKEVYHCRSAQEALIKFVNKEHVL